MNVRAAFRVQAEFCQALGSPFTARLCRLLAARLERGDPVADRVLGWHGDPSPRADALPLRLAGALHGVVLEGRDVGLAACYRPEVLAGDDAALWQAVAAAFRSHGDFLLARLEAPPQTNETMRSAALCPGLLTVAAQTGLPLAVSELGASAGLNLAWDHFAYRFGPAAWGDPASPVRIAPSWDGPAPPLPQAVVTERAGCDRAPPDVGRAEDRQRLLSFVWADQAERKARTGAAIELAGAAGIRIDRADAGDWLAARLATDRPGRAHVVYHSIFWQYLDAPTRERLTTLLADAGARASAAAPLAWLRMEGDGRQPGAAILLTLWPGGATQGIARADFHGRWVRWTGWR